MDISTSVCPHLSPTFENQENSKFCFYYDPIPDNRHIVGFCKRNDMYRCIHAATQPSCHIPLSHSSVQDFLSCHHLYYLKAIRGIQVRSASVSNPLKMGSLWDRALQKHYGGNVNLNDIIEEYEIGNYEIAKVRAMFKAYKHLGIQVDDGYDLQSKVNIILPFPWSWGEDIPVELQVTGFYDRKYPTYFAENKFTSRPDNYDDIFFIQSQIGTYFLADPELEYCIMEIARTPQLRVATKKGEEESSESYEERIFQDIISRPAYYFIGWDNGKKRYGKKFHRSEFNLEELRSRYLHIFREIHQARTCNGFYKSDKSCKNLLPGIQCDMLGVCRYDHMAENFYQIREKPFLIPKDCKNASNSVPLLNPHEKGNPEARAWSEKQANRKE